MSAQYYSSSAASEKLEEIDEEEQLMWQSEHAAAHHHHHRHHHHHIPEEDEEDDQDSEEDELMIEDASSMSSSPSIPDENINFDLVYALHTFVATVEGQASVVKGDALILMEDTNIYWWLVEVLKTREVGYIPAENIETPYERLARLNKHRNVEITSPSIHDTTPLPLMAQHPLNPTRRVTIGDESMSKIFHYEVESEIDEDEEQDRFEEEDEDELEEEEHADQEIQHQEEFHEMIMDPEEPAETKQEWQEKSWDTEDAQQPAEIPSASTTCSTLEQNSEEDQPQTMDLRVFAGNIGQGPLFHTFSISLSTTADDLVKTSVQKFGMNSNMESSQDTTIEYYLAVQGMDGDEYVLSAQDKPFSIFKTLTDSLTTPMPSFSHIKRISQQSLSSLQSRNSTSRRPRSSSFSNYEQTSYDEDSVIRFYLHRRIKRAHEREGLLYIKVSLYPDETSIQIRSEIDRIDKIISVRQESPIGAVINLALEKFHVPDAVADDYQAGNYEQLRDSRQLGKYKMSVRGNGQETELDPKELMSNVLLQQKSSSPNHTGPITSDLLFVLRKAGSVVKKPSQKERHLSTQKSNQVDQLPQLSIAQQSEEYTRRPSILDILMDAAPKMGERRPSVMSSLLEPPPRLTEDNRRPSGLNSINQERKPHQQQYTQQTSPSSSSSSSFPTSTKSPNSILGFNRRSSAQSSSVISSSSIDEHQLVNSDSTLIMDHLEVTPTSSSSIMRPSNSNSTDSRKKESFKQQFKRFVGWGSSSSSSSSAKKQSNIPPPLTTPFFTQSDIQSPSDISFVSAPSTPLPPTPGTPRSFLPGNSKSRQGSASHPLEVSTPIMSRRPSETTTLNDPSAAAMAAAAAVTAANKRLSTVSSVSSSTASSVTSEEIAAAANQGLMMTDTNDDDDDSLDDEEGQQEEPVSVMNNVETKNSLEQPANAPQAMQAEATVVEEPNDIQAQYAMWMNSQTNVHIPEEETNIAPIPPAKSPASSIITAANTAILTKALPPVTPQQPAKSPLRNKSSNISNATTATTNVATSVVATTPAQSTCATTATPSIASANTKTEIDDSMMDSSSVHQQQQQQQQQQQLEPLHPMPSNNGQDLDDLFLLVAHGVDFLTSRENTKWEEEGGYDFHPWNRPQSSFAVRQREQQQRNKEVPPLPVDYTSLRNQSHDGSNVSVSDLSANNNGNHEGASDNTSAALAMARSLLLSPTASEEQQQQQQQQNKPISPPLTPLPQQPLQENPQEEHVQQPQSQQQQQQQQQQESPLSMAKRILGAKVEIQSPNPQPVSQQPQPQQHQSVDDEELQRIVASHIVF
ncbi:hypothetical protein HMPREF1544_08458 [Mucor circinelloides 1006PhL]|uniref:SH3 domain-containing protein n=1 Tax=Mucor circinelloides f. circinelloides (strain 1006PhL) TaxID=1220926 RepID=S2JY94_MUCC1|nr:hypothetical protein HMPREF1544_08458 [Mucor circinelloides 1006PhL]